MSRVKLLKSELWDNDIPALCMICGENDAQTKHDFVARHVFFPLNLLGIAGVYMTPKKMPMAVACCNDCKPGFLNEQNMSLVWQSLRLLVPLAFLYALTANSANLPKSLVFPAIFAVSVYALEFFYFWTVGKKSAVRCAKMDAGTVSLDLPSGKWSVAYTTYKREKNQKRKASMAPPQVAPQPAAAGGEPGGVSSPPAAAPTIQTPPAGEVSQIEGGDLGHIPSELPPYLDAIKMGDSDRVKAALTDGADMHMKLENGMNALHIAAIAGVMQMADGLIRNGVDPNSEMRNGLTPMHLAVQANNQSIVGLLLAKKGDPNHKNAQGRTPLHWCAAVQDTRLNSNNRYKMAQVLVRGGGDVHAVDNDGKTPADLATAIGESQAAEAFTA